MHRQAATTKSRSNWPNTNRTSNATPLPNPARRGFPAYQCPRTCAPARTTGSLDPPTNPTSKKAYRSYSKPASLRKSLSRTHVDAEPLLYAGDGRCLVEISITGHTSTLATWYEIWAAVAAITSMCTRGKGIGGKARGFGECLVLSRPALSWLGTCAYTLVALIGAHRNIVLELSDKAASGGRLLNVTGREARVDWL